MAKTRIELTDTTIGMIMKMSGGNPGAVSVLTQMLTEGERIDPQSALGGLGGILSLDTHGIYEDKIWMLYKDICDQDITATIGVLRGIQLGLVNESEITSALKQSYATLPDGRLDEILAQVRERLSSFAK